jgi:hypothetical protein
MRGETSSKQEAIKDGVFLGILRYWSDPTMLQYIYRFEKDVPRNLTRGDEANMEDVVGLVVAIFVRYSTSVIYLFQVKRIPLETLKTSMLKKKLRLSRFFTRKTSEFEFNFQGRQ